jgi:thiamine monophosphate synthase
VRAFIAEFREIDVTEDTELQGLISQINALTDGLDCKQLRESDELTNSMLKAAESLQSEFEQMMADAPVRMVTLEDDDE